MSMGTAYSELERLKEELALTRGTLESRERNIEDLTEALTGFRLLVRDLDVAMHGEEGAAKQASLCDLIPLAKRQRERLDQLAAGLENCVEDARLRNDTYDVGYMGAMLKMVNEMLGRKPS